MLFLNFSFLYFSCGHLKCKPNKTTKKYLLFSKLFSKVYTVSVKIYQIFRERGTVCGVRIPYSVLGCPWSHLGRMPGSHYWCTSCLDRCASLPLKDLRKRVCILDICCLYFPCTWPRDKQHHLLIWACHIYYILRYVCTFCYDVWGGAKTRMPHICRTWHATPRKFQYWC